MRLKIANIEEYPLNNLTFSWEIILFWCELEFRHVYISRSVSPHGRFWKLNIDIPWLLRSYVPAVHVSYKMYVCSYTADFYSFSLKFRTAIYLIMPGLCNSSVVSGYWLQIICRIWWLHLSTQDQVTGKWFEICADLNYCLRCFFSFFRPPSAAPNKMIYFLLTLFIPKALLNFK